MSQLSCLYAAYRRDFGWVPPSSISTDPETVGKWVCANYVSYESRKRFKLVKLNFKVEVIGDVVK